MFGYDSGYVAREIELDGLALVRSAPASAGLSIRATGSVDDFVVSIQGFKINSFHTGITIDNEGISTPVSIEFSDVDIVPRGAGSGIVFNAGTGATRARFLYNEIATHGFADGISVETTGTSGVYVFEGNEISTSGGGDAIRVSGDAQSNTLTFSKNQLSANTQPYAKDVAAIALNVAISPSSKVAVDVTGNDLSTQSMGTGLVLKGGHAFQARVQGNNFDLNRVGVQVFGDGTTAGNVDLGGGSLGSTGGNNFASYVEADQPYVYAIGLFSVAPGYAIRAMLNKFSVSPSLVIADGKHNPGAGGSGIIFVSAFGGHAPRKGTDTISASDAAFFSAFGDEQGGSFFKF